MAIRPLDAFWSSLKTTPGRLRLAGVVIAVLHILSVPLWVKGYWAPRSAVMRLLYQCLGGQEDEQARWNPEFVVVSACEKPILTAISPTQTRIGVRARSHNEDWIVDVNTGKVLVAVPHAGLGFVDFISDDLAVRRWMEVDRRAIVHTIFDLQTGEVLEPTRVVFQDPDLDDLRELFRESNGNAVFFTGGHFRGILFFSDHGVQVRDFQSTIPKSVQDLVDSWGIPKVSSRMVEAVETDITRGDDTCLIGIESVPNPVIGFPSVCFTAMTEPILRKP